MLQKFFSKDQKESKQEPKQNENKQEEQKSNSSIMEESPRPKSTVIEKKSQLETMLNTQNAKGKTVLHKAAKNNNAAIIKSLLLEKNINLNLLNDAGFAALHVAAMNDSTEALFELMKKANIDLQTKTGETALHKAIQAQKLANVKVLLSKCGTSLTTFKVMDNSSADQGLSTILHYACEYLHAAILNEIFLANKKLLDQPNQKNNTPLHLLLLNINVNIISQSLFEELLKHATLTLKNGNNQSYLHAAAINSKNMSLELFKSLLTSLRKFKGEFEIALPMIDAVDVNNNTALYYLIKNNQLEHAMELLAYNPDVNIWKGESPLNLAIQHNMTDVVIKLLELRADPNAQDKQGKTALEYAAQTGNVAIIEALAKAKADFTVKQDDIVKTCLLSKLANKAEVLTKLIGYGASPNVHVHPRNPISSKFSKSSSFSVSSRSSVSLGHEDTANILAQGDTPLHYAIKIEDEKLAQICLQKSPTLVNEANDEGQTPAYLAIKFLSPQLAHLLFKKGAKLQYNIPVSANTSSLWSSENRQNTLYMIAMGNRGFESEQQLQEFFENPDYELIEKQKELRDKFLKKFSSEHPEKHVSKVKMFSSHHALVKESKQPVVDNNAMVAEIPKQSAENSGVAQQQTVVNTTVTPEENQQLTM